MKVSDKVPIPGAEESVLNMPYVRQIEAEYADSQVAELKRDKGSSLMGDTFINEVDQYLDFKPEELKEEARIDFEDPEEELPMQEIGLEKHKSKRIKNTLQSDHFKKLASHSSMSINKAEP